MKNEIPNDSIMFSLLFALLFLLQRDITEGLHILLYFIVAAILISSLWAIFLHPKNPYIEGGLVSIVLPLVSRVYGSDVYSNTYLYREGSQIINIETAFKNVIIVILVLMITSGIISIHLDRKNSNERKSPSFSLKHLLCFAGFYVFSYVITNTYLLVLLYLIVAISVINYRSSHYVIKNAFAEGAFISALLPFLTLGRFLDVYTGGPNNPELRHFLINRYCIDSIGIWALFIFLFFTTGGFVCSCISRMRMRNQDINTKVLKDHQNGGIQ